MLVKIAMTSLFVKARNWAAVAAAAGGLVTATALPLSGATAYASSPAVDPAPQARAQRVNQTDRLERLLKREQTVLQNEAKRLQQAATVETKLQDRINDLKGKGKDTSALEKALADFKAAIATAQSDYDTAKTTLDAHAGFGSNGEVLDIKQARQTILAAGKAERQFHQTVRKAARELRREVRQYRLSERPNPATVPNGNATPQPRVVM